MMYLCVMQGYDKAYKDRKSLKAKCDKAAALLAENGFVVRKAAADTDKPDMPAPASADGASGPNLSGAHSGRGSGDARGSGEPDGSAGAAGGVDEALLTPAERETLRNVGVVKCSAVQLGELVATISAHAQKCPGGDMRIVHEKQSAHFYGEVHVFHLNCTECRFVETRRQTGVFL